MSQIAHELNEHLREATKLAHVLNCKAQQEATIRAAIYINFVHATTNGINIPLITADQRTTSALVLDVLSAYHENKAAK